MRYVVVEGKYRINEISDHKRTNFPYPMDPAGDDALMTPDPEKDQYSLRVATAADIPTLACHHRKMFEEIRLRAQEPVDLVRMAAVEKEYTGKLKRELDFGTCRAWVVENEGTILASGAVTIVPYVPTPDDISCSIGLLHSVYTEKGHRNRGYAGRIVMAITGFCKVQGVRRIQLYASEAAMPVYAKNGFVVAANAMRTLLP